MDFLIREAGTSDVKSLAYMNKHLIEDEGSRNPMNLGQLEERMKTILKEWIVLLVNDGSEDLGYMVYKVNRDEYFPDQKELYIRQYFIKREHRSKGIGEQAFEAIAEKYFPEDAILSLDVLECNPKGRKFWEKIGFKPHQTLMKRH